MYVFIFMLNYTSVELVSLIVRLISAIAHLSMVLSSIFIWLIRDISHWLPVLLMNTVLLLQLHGLSMNTSFIVVLYIVLYVILVIVVFLHSIGLEQPISNILMSNIISFILNLLSSWLRYKPFLWLVFYLVCLSILCVG